MPTPDRDELRRLHFVNALFAHVTGHDLYLAQQIQAAITTSLTEAEQRPPADPEFIAAAARLLEKLCSGLPRHGFYHWNAAHTLTAAKPLFARAEIMAGLKHLSSYRESTLLITNLRAALLPPSGRYTERARRDYESLLSLIRDLAAARTARSANLNLLFL
ncbi:MAG TPA: hypothetical protein VK785_08320 [Opitutaceae bacterium]|jgi:hypothetical protein|nr:hypothetical protein [Opitutaceae bacterium]